MNYGIKVQPNTTSAPLWNFLNAMAKGMLFNSLIVHNVDEVILELESDSDEAARSFVKVVGEMNTLFTGQLR